MELHKTISLVLKKFKIDGVIARSDLIKNLRESK